MSTLEALVHAEARLFKSLADAWLATGASAFGIDIGGKTIAHWANDGDAQNALRSLIRCGPHSFGELWVHGVNDAGASARLESDASLIARLLQRDDEINTIIADHVATQDQLLALYDLNRVMKGRLDLDEMLSTLAKQVARLLNVDRAFATLIKKDSRRLIATTTPFVADDVLIAIAHDAFASEGHVMLEPEADGFKENDSLLCLANEAGLGNLIALGWVTDAARGFTSPQLKLARTLADWAGTHIESAILHQESIAQVRIKTEIDLASDIYHRMLPSAMPSHPKLDVAAHCKPATEIGGDYYDLIWDNTNPFVFSVGDVTGKGMPAAMVMSILTFNIRAKARHLAQGDPANIFTVVNRDLLDDISNLGMFSTAFVGSLDGNTGQLKYANAGHSPVMLCSAGEPARLLQADDPPLCVVPDWEYTCRQLSLHAGDVIVVASDGFNEATNAAGEMLGVDTLLRMIEQNAAGSAQHIADRLYECAADFAGDRPQTDDQTLVVIKMI